MNRREALKALGTALAVPALQSLNGTELLALGHEMHARIRAESASDYHMFKSLDPQQNETVSIIADLIIPETDTPGALDAEVNVFMDVMLSDIFDAETRERFLKGLAHLDRESRSRYGREFARCDEKEQIELLESQEAEASAELIASGRQPQLSWGRTIPPRVHFFHTIKYLTLFGYYTSEAGMLQEMGFQMIPGKYAGCEQS